MQGQVLAVAAWDLLRNILAWPLPALRAPKLGWVGEPALARGWARWAARPTSSRLRIRLDGNRLRPHSPPTIQVSNIRTLQQLAPGFRKR